MTICAAAVKAVSGALCSGVRFSAAGRRAAVLLLGMLLAGEALAACTMIQSHRVQPCGATPCANAAGSAYSLPVGRFLLKASRVAATSQVAGATTALGTAKDNFTKDNQDLTTATQKQAKDAADKTATKATQDSDTAAVAAAQLIVNADKALLKSAQDALNTLAAAPDKGIETFTLQQQSNAADPSARYIANLDHGAFRDDTLQIDIADGMLTSVAGTATDQSLNALVKLVETGISIATFAASGVPLVPAGAGDFANRGVEGATPPAFPLACTYDIQEMFDPVNPHDIARVNQILAANNATFRLSSDQARPGDLVSLSRLTVQANDNIAAANATLDKAKQTLKADALKTLAKDDKQKLLDQDQAQVDLLNNRLDQANTQLADAKRNLMRWDGLPQIQTDIPQDVAGLVYRTPTSVIVSAEADASATYWADGGPLLASGQRCSLMAKPASQSTLAIVPDSRTSYVLDSKIGAFTTTGLTYKFTGGMLTQSIASRPSEALQPINALNQLATDIIAIPGSILKLRLDYTNNSADLVKAQTTLANNRSDRAAAMVNAQAALANANAALVKAQFGDAQAWADAQKSLVTAEQALQNLGVANYQPPYPTPLGAAP